MLVRSSPRPLISRGRTLSRTASRCVCDSSRDCSSLPPTVNWHLVPTCNYKCRFCFATFPDIPHADARMPLNDKLKVLQKLQAAGCQRVNFVGGEPFLDKDLEQLIISCKALGMNTSVVTNASLLQPDTLLRLAGHLDVLGISCDASNDGLHALMGRGRAHEVVSLQASHAAAAAASAQAEPLVSPQATAHTPSNGHIQHIRNLWPAAQELGLVLKLNTVINRLNLHDDMTPLLLELAPARWKVFQVLPVEGQNSGQVEPLLINRQEFDQWVTRHNAVLEAAGSSLRATDESNDKMRGSYAMLDARGCFYHNTAGPHEYGRSLLEVGVAAAWQDVEERFRPEVYVARGGIWKHSQDQPGWDQEQAWGSKWVAS